MAPGSLPCEPREASITSGRFISQRRRLLQSLLAVPCVALGAKGAAPPRLAYLATTTPRRELEKGLASSSGGTVAFLRGLAALGWRDGANLRIEWRSAEDDYQRLPELARDIVRSGPDVIVTFGFGIDAVLSATRRVPVVGMHSELVRPGWAQSMSRPGGNLTGIASAVSGLESQKQLAWLKEASPRVRKVALFAQAQGAAADDLERIARQPRFVEAARALDLELFVVSFGTVHDIPAAVASAARQGADALLVDEISVLSWPPQQRTLSQEAERHRLLVMHSMLNATEHGGLMAFGRDLTVDFARLAHFVDRILRGTPPSELPIEQGSRRELRLNLKAAKAIGLAFPPRLLLQADRVIE
jgi:putative ABC transport system substrate-binding protein